MDQTEGNTSHTLKPQSSKRQRERDGRQSKRKQGTQHSMTDKQTNKQMPKNLQDKNGDTSVRFSDSDS